MSLLLEALRRAEEDSRKRKLATAAAATLAPAAAAAPAPIAAPAEPLPAAKREALQVELTLQEQTPAPASPAASPVFGASEPPTVQPPATTNSPDLTPASAETPAAPPARETAPVSPNPRTALPPYARPSNPEAAQTADSATARRTVFRAPEAPIAKPAPERIDLAAPILATTHRQALSAAGVMAGPQAQKTSGKQQKRRLRQWLLAAVALVVALPLAALLLFGDAFFGSPGTLLATHAPKVAAPLPDSPSVSPSDVPAAVSRAPAAAQETAKVVVPPAVPAAVSRVARETPGPVEARVAPRTRVVADAPSPGAAGKPSQGSAAKHNAATAAANPAGPSLVVNPAKSTSLMDSAYAAYQAGQLGEATQLYREVLKADPTQRDAWLGLAVIAHASKQREPAMDAYKQVLRLDPQNATALAGVSSLMSRNAGEPQQESRLRELLARSPQEADLNHALGLVLSGEQRWSEAQPLFFKAHALAPQEPQFAYNLAVTLDHLRKSSLAAQYYETALGLAQGKVSGFDESSARSRLAALKSGASERTTR